VGDPVNAALVDTVTRGLLAAGTVYVVVRGFVYHARNHITSPSRVRSLAVLSTMLVPGAIFWIVITLERSRARDALQFDIWLSRFAWLWVVVGAFVLQSLIRQAEEAE
jgi:hypothetical protein